MTDPNAEVPRPAVDPWADAATPEAWAPSGPPAPPTVPDPHYPRPATVPATAPGAQFHPGQAVVPAGPVYSPTDIYVPSSGYHTLEGYPAPPPPRGGGRAAAIIVGLLVLVVVGVGVFFLPKLLPSHNNATGPNGGQSSGPTGSASAHQTTAPPPDIFAGTPAESFQAATDAIAPPAPQAVTGFSASDVGNDLTMVKQAMTAARLDPKMLVDHDASNFINLLAPDGRQTVQDYFTSNNAFPYATRLQADTTLTNDPIRAKGVWTVTGQQVDNRPAVVIETNYIWVYPVAANRSGVGANLIVVRDQITWVVYDSDGLESSSVGLWVKHAAAFGSNLDCDVIHSDDLVALAKTSISEQSSEEGDAYNLDADFTHAHFVC
jgi:hypothetical protein